MSGYYNAAASVLDYDRLQRNASVAAAYCKKNKSRALPTAIQNRARWAGGVFQPLTVAQYSHPYADLRCGRECVGGRGGGPA
jgi:hypothetical protein